MNIVVLQGTLVPSARDPIDANGDVITYEVTTRPDEGPAVTAPVAWFEPPKAAYALERGRLGHRASGRCAAGSFAAAARRRAAPRSWPSSSCRADARAQIARPSSACCAELDGAAPGLRPRRTAQ